MAYVLLAVGALMSLAGAVAAINGYSIIQVEQGWASVIAGATLFTGGIVTVGLALLLRAIGQLQMPQTHAAPAPDARTSQHEPAFAPLTTASDTKHEDAPAEENYAPAFADVTPMEEAMAVESYQGHSERQHDVFAVTENNAASRGPAASPPASPPLSDDWFDRAFAELDQPPVERNPLLPTRGRGKTETPAPTEAPAASRAREPAYASAAMEAPVPEPVEPPSSAIIGRYEADETSYIMYADGSIEAQTHSGVYRFASMAELKAFIES